MTVWTQRTNGMEMATLRLTVHVPREMVVWAASVSGQGEDQALASIRPWLPELDAENASLAWSPDTYRFTVASGDRDRFVGLRVYRGPDPIWAY